MFPKRFPLYFVLALFAAVLLFSSASNAKAIGPVEAHYVHYVPGKKTAVRNAIILLGGQTSYSFDSINALAVTLPEGTGAALDLNSNITFHEPVPAHQPYSSGQTIPWNVEMLQAPDVWDADRDGVLDENAPTGAGLTVCIIDSGFHGTHEDFQGFNVSGVSQILGENWNEDGNGHGTHVAGTINAQNNDVGVVGVSPGQADLFIVKVFDNNGEWAIGQSNLGAAAESCRDNGADIISMSLGGGASTTEQQIFQDLYDVDGILNVAAAGNDGTPDNSYPANYPAVISVAAVQESERIADFSQFPPTQNDPNSQPANVHWDTTELAAGGQDVPSTWPYFIDHRATVAGVSYSANRIDEAPFGQAIAPLIDGGLCTQASGSLDWSDTIVLCSRGEVSFAEKVNEANLWGAAGVIIYNNVPGNFNGTCNGECVPNLIPAISLSQADGQFLVDNRVGQIGRIISNETDGDNGYNAISGTSMATPAVSASAAVLWSACGGPAGISNKELRQLMRDSARDLSGSRDAGGSYGAGYDDYTGFGLVQINDARQLANGRFGDEICPLDGIPNPPPPEIPDFMASGWTLVKFPQGQPVCTGVGYQGIFHYDRLDCGFGYVAVSETAANSTVKVQLLDGDGNIVDTQTTTYRTEEAAWEFDMVPAADWASGNVTIRVSEVNGYSGNFGETTFFLNQLGATIAATGTGYAPGDAVTASGTIFEIDQTLPTGTMNTAVPATFSVQVYTPEGDVRGPYGPYTAEMDGSFTITLPGEATAEVTADADDGFESVLALEVVDASYDDLLTGEWSAARAGAGSVKVTTPNAAVVLETSFVSSVGWVKPGEKYPFRVFVKNFTASDITNAVVTLDNVDGSTYTLQTADLGSAVISGDINSSTLTWNVGTVPAGAFATLVVEAQADDTGQDPRIVWKDISSVATLDYDGGSSQSSRSHGPKVIPPSSIFDSARFGDRPFPVVPVDYIDRSHQANHTGELLADKINNPDIVGSTYNLFQEMSLGQLFPNGTVPSAGIATADFNVDWQGDRYTDNQFAFSDNMPQGVCYGTQIGAAAGTPLYAERIVDGWYQLPGTTAYYGGDKYSLGAIAGAVGGVGLLMDIDSACGPTGKAVYDAAHIADPEIDYNDYDTDKDGVVDFFMMVFAGCGGNGSSQLGPAGCDLDDNAPYDNIWPHSSSLEFYFTDAETGLNGYISDDQLRSLTDVPQCWLSDSYATYDDCAAAGGAGDDSLPVYVRVGPYNVNPEDAIDNASVISHEYGHSLGLPDFYSLGGRDTYGDWNLMATDKSHHMDVFAKQEMGWVVPMPLTQDTTVFDWKDSKFDTGEIHWQQPDGTPYTLSADNGHQHVHNAETYVVKLPAKQLIDPAKVAAGASLDHVWFSGSGNDFGCAPTGGRNLDIYLPELANAAPGAEVIVTFKSYFDIEWDYDYGFVMYSHDGAAYTSLPSENGYTTPASQNPNQNSCQAQYGNGLTGTSGSYAAGTATTDRLLGEYPDGGFIVDRYDLSAAAGEETVLRFSYATDPGLARPGWFIDDLVVTIDGVVVYDTDFEDHHDERLFAGGCNPHGATAQTCTAGWQQVSASQGSTADHAYYLEMRDRSGFDFDGNGENDRDPIGFDPGLLLVITDESHGYGNTGADNFPAQSPVDSRPEVGSDTPNLNDAAFKVGDSYSDFGATGWIDNYSDPDTADGNWHHAYDCLSFTVDSMVGHDTIGPNTVGDLVGTVTFDLGAGCGVFDYGYE